MVQRSTGERWAAGAAVYGGSGVGTAVGQPQVHTRRKQEDLTSRGRALLGAREADAGVQAANTSKAVQSRAARPPCCTATPTHSLNGGDDEGRGWACVGSPHPKGSTRRAPHGPHPTSGLVAQVCGQGGEEEDAGQVHAVGHGAARAARGGYVHAPGQVRRVIWAPCGCGVGGQVGRRVGTLYLGRCGV